MFPPMNNIPDSVRPHIFKTINENRKKYELEKKEKRYL